MFNDDELDFLPPKDEDIPARLAKKWDEREKREGVMTCPSCKKQILAASSFCAYCGDTLDGHGRLWKMVAVLILLIGLFFLAVRVVGYFKV